MAGPQGFWGKTPGTLTAPGATGPSTLSRLGTGAMIGGAASAAIGAYYSAEAARYQARSQALEAEFAASMAGLNARAAEQDAQQILRAAQQEVGRAGLQYRMFRAAARKSAAARGVQAGVGSAGEVAASIEFARETDQNTITLNGIRAANAARISGANSQNQALLARTSAANLRGTAGSISPLMAGGTSLLGSAASVAQTWLASNRSNRRYSRYDE